MPRTATPADAWVLQLRLRAERSATPRVAGLFPWGQRKEAGGVRGGLTMDENESRVRLAILAGYGDELPRAVESAILYEVDLLMTNPTVYDLRSASICERAHVRDFR